MSEASGAWRESLRELAERAPDWMRERASSELHIGGFTQVTLDTPALEVSDLAGSPAAEQTLTFFLATSLAAGARVARVQCGRSDAGRDLVKYARRALGPAIERLDAENAALMGYFDVYLRPAEDLSSAACARLARRLRQALDDAGKGIAPSLP